MTIFKPIKIRGTIYDCTHLSPIMIDVTVGQDDKAQTFRVRVNFSCHCFTQELDSAVHTPDYHYNHDGEKRAFCADRYEHSKKLPNIIRSLDNKKVHFTWEKNYLHVEMIGEDGTKVPYAIFFDLKKGKKNDANVVMTIVSAYEKQGLTDKLSAIKFHTLVAKIARGEKVSIPPPTRRKRK